MLSAVPAFAQSGSSGDRNQWSFEVTPYLWAAGLQGDVEVRNRKASVDPSFSDLLKDLDFGVMTAAEIRYGRWGFLFDGMYMRLSKDGDTPGPLFAGVDVVSKTGIIAGSFMYRPVWLDRFTLDILAGARAWILDTELEFKPGILPGVTVSKSTAFADPIIGLRAAVNVTDRLSVSVLGDVGGFGVSSDLTWQAFGGIEYRFARHWSARVGYRALGIDFEKAQIKLDAVMHGPVLGVSFRF
jgi:opacity protein-like surface antigen